MSVPPLHRVCNYFGHSSHVALYEGEFGIRDPSKFRIVGEIIFDVLCERLILFWAAESQPPSEIRQLLSPVPPLALPSVRSPSPRSAAIPSSQSPFPVSKCGHGCGPPKETRWS